MSDFTYMSNTPHEQFVEIFTAIGAIDAPITHILVGRGEGFESSQGFMLLRRDEVVDMSGTYSGIWVTWRLKADAMKKVPAYFQHNILIHTIDDFVDIVRSASPGLLETLIDKGVVK